MKEVTSAEMEVKKRKYEQNFTNPFIQGTFIQSGFVRSGEIVGPYLFCFGWTSLLTPEEVVLRNRD